MEVKIMLVNKKNEILLQLRGQNQINAGKWTLWGGHVEKGESPEEAIIRELKEEINFELKEFKKIYETIDEKNVKRIWYIGPINKNILDLHLNEGEEMRFYSYKKIKSLDLTKNIKMILNKIFN